MPAGVVFSIFLLIVLVTAFFILLPNVRDSVREPPEIATETPPEMEPNNASAPEVVPAAPPVERPPEIRRQGIYFMRVDGDDLSLAMAERTPRPSDTPLFDSLTVLLAGPTAEERARGLISFIPENTQVLSAIVRGNTAYVSFSDDFRFSTHGREGYISQVRQVVWTATEFPNVHDVQILIEGRRIDILSEGVVIGTPIGR